MLSCVKKNDNLIQRWTLLGRRNFIKKFFLIFHFWSMTMISVIFHELAILTVTMLLAGSHVAKEAGAAASELGANIITNLWSYFDIYKNLVLQANLTQFIIFKKLFPTAQPISYLRISDKICKDAELEFRSWLDCVMRIDDDIRQLSGPRATRSQQ